MSEASGFVLFGRHFKPSLLHVASKRWQMCCSSFYTSNEVSPESLWEVGSSYCLTSSCYYNNVYSQFKDNFLF